MLGIVVPSYGHFNYVAKAVASALRTSHAGDVHVLVVDDASPDWAIGYRQHLARFHDSDTKHRFHIARFEANGGLTRSWNRGLEFFRDVGCDFICVTNSDVVFPENWFVGMPKALREADLVGPLTNAPGTEEHQYVADYTPIYRAGTSDGADINAVQEDLLRRYREASVKECPLNGFCLVANTTTWWQHSYDDAHVFRPRNDFNSKGDRNPTPLMTLNEYELQHRWRAAQLVIGRCLASYVFHYRAVTRGPAYRRGDWARLPADEGTDHDRHHYPV